jgi:hypothetical protein
MVCVKALEFKIDPWRNPFRFEQIVFAFLCSLYREGASDKAYQAAIESAGDLFVVNFACGHRGAALATGTKTSSSVDYDTAK